MLQSVTLLFADEWHYQVFNFELQLLVLHCFFRFCLDSYGVVIQHVHWHEGRWLSWTPSPEDSTVLWELTTKLSAFCIVFNNKCVNVPHDKLVTLWCSVKAWISLIIFCTDSEKWKVFNIWGTGLTMSKLFIYLIGLNRISLRAAEIFPSVTQFNFCSLQETWVFKWALVLIN